MLSPHSVSQPRLVFKLPPYMTPTASSLQSQVALDTHSTGLIPLFNCLIHLPSDAKKKRHLAFASSAGLSYPSLPVNSVSPFSLPDTLQTIYDDAYLGNASPESLTSSDLSEWQIIFQGFSPCEYCKSHGLSELCRIRPDSIFCATCEHNYPSAKKSCSFKNIFWLLQFHILAKLPIIVTHRIVEEKALYIIRPAEWRTLVESLSRISYYQEHPEELGLETPNQKQAEESKPPTHELPDADVMELAYPPPSPPNQLSTSVFQPASPSMPINSDPCVFWDLSGLKVWFFNEIVDVSSEVVDPSHCEAGPSHRKAALQKVFERMESHMASLLAGPGKILTEMDLWHIVDIVVAQAFTTIDEQLRKYPNLLPSHDDYATISSLSHTLTALLSDSACIINDQQGKLIKVYRDIAGLKDLVKELQERLAVEGGQVQSAEEELGRLWKFVMEYTALSAQSELSNLHCQFEEQELSLGLSQTRVVELERRLEESERENRERNKELTRLRHFVTSIQGQFAAVSPNKPTSSS
ncbi:hypothetical protein GYMLUDRAFT_244154 [Collybiopsis luxurians FD-317 M1]|uniref:Unplaced genomic scaffold GYMLUscaffold_26, whole genome shotgun sequence n=1 Tax=Collybiopsis luxurians FD-317 M1 TaxID=944289 RepID=A0A0D0BA69_9AGAR|nr:hypothetical protein GYMLUDRAFT_244154 [Collybiopsis luxurians FD-317 M1]